MRVLHEWLYSVRVRCLARDGAASVGVPAPLPPSRNASASSTSTSTASSLEGMSAGELSRVADAISSLEAAENVSVLWAVERSSRAFGTHRADSDFDVLAVFALPVEALLSMDPQRKSLVLTLGGGDGGDGGGDGAASEEEGDLESRAPITITAYEVRHACMLLSQTNPTMFDALRSPIVYRDHEALGRARTLLNQTADADALRIAYRKMARNDFRVHVLQRGGGRHGTGARVVRGKKYARVLRELLTADWLERRRTAASTTSGPTDISDDGARGLGDQWPPINLTQLAAAQWVPRYRCWLRMLQSG